MPLSNTAIMHRSDIESHKIGDKQQATESHRLRGEAARLRRVAEGLNSKADRDTILRLAEDADRALAASERGTSTIRSIQNMNPSDVADI